MTMPEPTTDATATPERADLSGLSDRQLLEAIAHWQNDANKLIKGLMDSVAEVRENPAVLFQGLLG